MEFGVVKGQEHIKRVLEVTAKAFFEETHK